MKTGVLKSISRSRALFLGLAACAMSAHHANAGTGANADLFDSRLADGLQAGEGAIKRNSIFDSKSAGPVPGGAGVADEPGEGGGSCGFSCCNPGAFCVYRFEDDLGRCVFVGHCDIADAICEGNSPTEDTPGRDDMPSTQPVDYVFGDKQEGTHDLIVRLTGEDFILSRGYTSDPAFDGAGLVGENWFATAFRFIWEEDVPSDEPLLHMAGPPVRQITFEHDDAESRWEAGGPTPQYIIESDVTIDSNKYATYALIEPGFWRQDFYRPHDASGGFTATPATHEGLLLQESDMYGNTRTYTYEVFGTALSSDKHHARLGKIICVRPDTTTPVTEAEIRFTWQDDDTEPEAGRLLNVKVFRNTDAVAVETQRVEYTYKADGDGLPDDLGTEGDLIDVRKYVPVDESTGDVSTWRLLATQYRYHGGNENEETDTDGDSFIEVGGAHQLKAVFLPEQIEYFAQQYCEAHSTDDSVADGADELLSLDDVDDWFENIGGQSASQFALDAASKVVAQYEDAGEGRVVSQFIMSECGCGGGGTHGMFYYYDYFTYSPGSHSNGAIYHTLEVEERYWNGSSWALHRTHYLDSGPPVDGGVSYLMNRAIVSGSKKWVNHIEYDAASRTPIRNMSPAAMSSYTPGTSSVAPSYTASASSGLVQALTWTSDNRIEGEYVGDGDLGAIGNFTLVRKRTYDATRKHLITKIERFRVAGSSAANDVETVEFDYGFHTGGQNDVAWYVGESEAELVSENGPGGTYEKYHLFDAYGRKHWTRLQDGALIKREFDGDTGELTKIAQNALTTGIPSHSGLTSGWGRNSDGGKLVTQYAVDDLGRIQKITAPGDVERYVRREMTAVTERPDVEYYTEVSLPAEVDASNAKYSGPATITVMNASGDMIKTSDWSLNITTPGGLATAYSTNTELTRRTVNHDVSGLATSTKVWHDISGDKFYVTSRTFDRLGRTATVTNFVGTITRNTYDELNRIIKEEKGTDDSGTGSDDMTIVMEAFYDSGGTATQGVGNGLITLRRMYVDGSTFRDMVFAHDYRNRQVSTKTPLKPHYLIAYDNLNRPIKHALFKTAAAPTAIDSDLSDRGRLTITSYSQRGTVWRTQQAIDATQSSPTYLETHNWYDENSRTVATWEPTRPARKSIYDGLGRVITSYVTDRRDDAAPGSSGNHADALDADGDVVLEQTDYRYIADRGVVDLVTQYALVHDATTSDTGDLGDFTGGDADEVITTFSGTFYDDVNRPIRRVAFGTNQTVYKHGGTAPTITQTSPPDANDAVATKLVTEIGYDARGLAETTTSPDEIVTKTVYDDMNRRIATIKNYVNAVVAWNSTDDRWQVSSGLDHTKMDEDRVTSFVYDGAGHVIKQVAHYPSGSDTELVQETEYVYGVSKGAGAGDSEIGSYDLLAEIRYPNESTGEADSSAAYTVKHAYNRLGELIYMKDQNLNVHDYTRNARGQVTLDEVTFDGSTTISQWVDRIETTYDDFGRPSTVKTKDNTTVLNAVEYEYDSLWHIDKIKQEPEGDIDGSTLDVQFLYSNSAGSANNFSRLTRVTYPDGSSINYVYGIAGVGGNPGSVNHEISRLQTIEENVIFGPDIVTYSYLGLGRHAITDYIQPDVQLDYAFAHDGEKAQGEYPGFDQYGRVIRHAWTDGSFDEHATDTTIPNVPPLFEAGYGYDNASNRTYMYDERPGASWDDRDWEYSYDGLDRLKEANRGVHGGSWTDGPGSEKYTLDMLGNWDVFEKDVNGDGDYLDDEEEDDREANDANEYTSAVFAIDRSRMADPNDTGGFAAIDYQHDDNGVATLSDKWVGPGDADVVEVTYTHDAWNRLVKVQYDDGGGDETRGEYEYNGLGHLVVKRGDMAFPSAGLGPTEERFLYYDDRWRIIETRVDDSFNETIDRINQLVWGDRYIDDAVLLRESDNLGNDSPATTWELESNYLTDAMFSAVGLINQSADLIERVRYSPYGVARHHYAEDVDGDGDVDSSDETAVTAADGKKIGDVGYKVELDVDRDGTIEGVASPGGAGLDDLLAVQAMTSFGALPEGWVSLPHSSGGIENSTALHGMQFAASTFLIQARHRWLSPSEGTWATRDPMGLTSVPTSGTEFDLSERMNLYQFSRSNPVVNLDPYGLCARYVPNPDGFVGPPDLYCGRSGARVPDFDSTFLACCADHDTCYGRCNATTKAACDTTFHACMRRACNRVRWYLRGLCREAANTYHAFVRDHGGTAWNEAKAAHCTCCDEWDDWHAGKLCGPIQDTPECGTGAGAGGGGAGGGGDGE